MAIAERVVLSLLAASAVAYTATPLAIALANRLEFYDRPAGYKAHGHPTPYLGGAAVMAGFLAALLLAAGHWHKTLPLVGGVALLWLVGTIDDRRTVSPLLRVAVEIALATLVWSVGLGWKLHMGGVLDLAVTCVWLVGVINAFNLFDNMDGAAGTMALAVSTGAAILGVVRGDAWLAVGAASLGGACLGFLPRNLALPARIFLGDGGSMPIGFVAAVLVMVAATTSSGGWESLPVALLLVGLPALDTTLVVVSRRRRGVPVLAGGKDHLTHRTRRLLPSARAVALGLGGIQASVSVLAVLAAQGGASFVVVAAILYTLGALAAIAVLEGRGLQPSEKPDAQTPEGAAPAHSLSVLNTAAPNAATQDSSAPNAATPDSPVRSATADTKPILAKAAIPGLAVLLVLGLGAGLSPFFFSYYDPTVWAPVGLGIVALCAVAIVARPAVPGAPATLALAGLLGLGVWSLCSTAWSESVEGAVVAGDRWLAYGALLLLLLVIVRSHRRAALALAAAGVGVTAVAISVLARLLGHDPTSLFLGGRLNEPLGYINGEGCLFAVGLWLCVALAESRRALLAGVGAGLAMTMACLALLSQSRGTALGVLVGLLATMALAPGRTRRAYALALLAGGLALAGPALLDVYRAAAGGAVPVGAAHRAGRATLLATLAVGCAWGIATAAWEAARSRAVSMGEPAAGPWTATMGMRTAGSWALAVPVVAAVALGAGSARAIEREVSAQWRAFTHLSSSTAGATAAHGSPARVPSAQQRASGPRESSAESRSRLLSGAGNRYDYWRIAWRLWQQHPLVGVGAGGYARYYYQRRATAEDIDQPHSMELGALSELGLIGALLLGLLFAGVVWGACARVRAARSSRLARAVLVASVGSFAAWLVQASVDWMHLLPGLTAIALIAVAAIVWPRHRPAREPGAATRGWPARPLLAVGASIVLVTVVVAGASLSRQALAQLYAQRAQAEVARRPAAAIADADRALGIDGDAVPTYYLKAAALAHYDRAAEAEATLRQALAREPDNFVTWALLGDVATREGRAADARRDYGRAHALNPRNATLKVLAVPPSGARSK